MTKLQVVNNYLGDQYQELEICKEFAWFYHSIVNMGFLRFPINFAKLLQIRNI